MPLPLLVFIAAAGLLGLAGGGPGQTLTHENTRVRLEVHTPTVVRSGEMFQRRIKIEVLQPITGLSISVPQSLLDELTVNSVLPQADDEFFTGGEYRAEYGEFDAGESLVVQMAIQANPDLKGKRRGDVVLRDGDAELARLTVPLTVLP